MIDKYRSGATLYIGAPLSKIVAGTYFDLTASQGTNRNSTETAHVMTGFSTNDHLLCLKYLRNSFSEGQSNSIKCLNSGTVLLEESNTARVKRKEVFEKPG